MAESRKSIPAVPSRRLPPGFGATMESSKANWARIARPDDYALARVMAISEAFSAHFGTDLPNVTMAVGVADDADGTSHKLISANEGNYMRGDVRLLAPPQPDEIVIDGFHHAELNIVGFVMSVDWKLRSLAATRPACLACRAAVGSYAIRPITIEKQAAAPLAGEPEPKEEAKNESELQVYESGKAAS